MFQHNTKKFFLCFLMIFLLSSPAISLTLENYEDENLLADEEERKKILKDKLKLCSTKRTALSLVVLDDIPPWSWSVKTKDRKGRIRKKFYGIDYKIAEELFKRSDVKFFEVFTEENPETLEEYLIEEGKMDLAVGVNPSHEEEIKERILYPSYFGNPIVPVFAKGKERKVDSIKDLAGLKGLALKSENIGSYLFDLPKSTNIRNISSAEAAFAKLLEEEVDFLLIGYYTATAESKRFKISDKVVILPKVITEIRRFVFMTDKRTKKHDCTPMREIFEEQLEVLYQDKPFMQNILRDVYKEYEEQHKADKPLKYLIPTSKIEAKAPSDITAPGADSAPSGTEKESKD